MCGDSALRSSPEGPGSFCTGATGRGKGLSGRHWPRVRILAESTVCRAHAVASSVHCSRERGGGGEVHGMAASQWPAAGGGGG